MLNPVTNMLIDAIIVAVFSVLKASGLTAEEAKAKFQEKVAQVESLPPMPMDLKS